MPYYTSPGHLVNNSLCYFRIRSKSTTYAKLLHSLHHPSPALMPSSQRVGSARSSGCSHNQTKLAWINNIIETEITLVDTPSVYELHISNDTVVHTERNIRSHVSDLIRLRLLVDYLSVLPTAEQVQPQILLKTSAPESSVQEADYSSSQQPGSVGVNTLSPCPSSVASNQVNDSESDTGSDIDEDMDNDADEGTHSAPYPAGSSTESNQDCTNFSAAMDELESLECGSRRSQSQTQSTRSSNQMQVHAIIDINNFQSLSVETFPSKRSPITDTAAGFHPDERIVSSWWTSEHEMFYNLTLQFAADPELQTSRRPILGHRYRSRTEADEDLNRMALQEFNSFLHVYDDRVADEGRQVIRFATNKVEHVVEAAEEYPVNIWTMSRLLCWCATNEEIIKCEVVGAPMQKYGDDGLGIHIGAQDYAGAGRNCRHLGRVREGDAYGRLRGREHEYYTLASRERRLHKRVPRVHAQGKRNFGGAHFVLPGQHRVLRECVVVPSPLSDLCAGNETNSPSPRLQLLRPRPQHTVHHVTSVRTTTPKSPVPTSPAAAALSDFHVYHQRIASDQADKDEYGQNLRNLYADSNIVGNVYQHSRAKTALQETQREKFISSQKMLEQQYLQQAMIDSRRAQIVSEKHEHTQKLQLHEDVLTHAGVLTSIIRQHEHASYAQLKANRTKFLLDRVKAYKQQRVEEHEQMHLLATLNEKHSQHRQRLSPDDMIFDMTDSLQDSTVMQSFRAVEVAPPAQPDILCVTPLSSRRQSMRPRSASSAYRQAHGQTHPLSLRAPPPTPPNPNRGTRFADGRRDSSLVSSFLIAPVTASPALDEQIYTPTGHTQPSSAISNIPLNASAGFGSSRRESFRRRSVLTVGTTASKTPTIEIPAPSVDRLYAEKYSERLFIEPTEPRTIRRPQSSSSSRQTSNSTQPANPAVQTNGQGRNKKLHERTAIAAALIPSNALGSLNNSSILSLEQTSTASIAESVNAVLCNLSRLNSAGSSAAKPTLTSSKLNSLQQPELDAGSADIAKLLIVARHNSTANKAKISKLMKETGHVNYYNQFSSDTS
jgi:hypothetical protein